MRFRHVRLVALLLCLLLSSGCSMIRVGYGHFDSVAAWMVHDYFDLNADQRDLFAQRFERLHAWHRQTQLPEYAQFLGDFQARAKRGLREADMLWAVDGFKQRYARIAVRGAADAADLLATLTPEQIETFRQQVDKDNKKFMREHRINDSEAERRKVVQQRTLSQLRDWVGLLNDIQETRIIAMLKTMPLVDKLRHEDRLRRQREFFALLELRAGDRAVFAQRLRDWLQHWEAGRGAEQTRLFDESWRKRAELYAAIDHTLTPAQRTHLLSKLQDYIDDFRELSKARPGVAQAR
ncbi:MAG: hypothetical protein K2X06_05930 [Burkholderiales bacterium]|nr:hypothetical protein [Burkholderiales bacterium]